MSDKTVINALPPDSYAITGEELQSIVTALSEAPAKFVHEPINLLQRIYRERRIVIQAPTEPGKPADPAEG